MYSRVLFVKVVVIFFIFIVFDWYQTAGSCILAGNVTSKTLHDEDREKKKKTKDNVLTVLCNFYMTET